jgi:hypothetical protein
VTDISNNLSNQLREKAREFKYYSFAMDDSTDSTDTVQLLIFICGTVINSAITMEQVGLCSMTGHTTRKETADEVIKSVTEKLGLTFDKLVAICTDCIPSTGGKHVGTEILWKNM